MKLIRQNKTNLLPHTVDVLFTARMSVNCQPPCVEGGGGAGRVVSTTVPATLDLSGIAVITGGASGFGLVVATRLVSAGMSGVAILDISRTALDRAREMMRAAGGTDAQVGMQTTISS